MSESVFDIITQYMDSAPVNVRGLCARLGIEISQAEMPEDCSGGLERINDDVYKIIVNASHSEVRKRFTIAHELGHYIYHRSLLGDGICDNTAYRSDRNSQYAHPHIGPDHETEANRFAAGLLMPGHLIRELWDHGITDSEKMADYLDVSKPAMRIRLRQLGLDVLPGSEAA